MRLTLTSFVRALTLAATLLATLPSHAWGEAGHRITGRIAQELLLPQTRTKIAALMGNLDLAGAALFLDQNKSALAKEFPGSRRWHYDDRPVCNAKAPRQSYCHNELCASMQIARHIDILSDAHAAPEKRRLALRVLVHLVGDIHQPLHSADHDDLGGNDVTVAFTLSDGEHETDLHTAWDTDLVLASFAGANVPAMAQSLLSGTDAASIKLMQKGSASQWLRESYALADQVAYGMLPGFACDKPDFASSPLRLDEAYVAKAKEVIPPQLLKAGARIAFVLNRALAKP